MADQDIAIAVVTKLRAVTAINSGVGGRFYGRRVPPDAPFPRSYTLLETGPRRRRAGIGDNGFDRVGMLNQLFACTSTETADPESFIEAMDVAAETALSNEGFVVPGFVYFRRVGEVPVYPQEVDRLTFFVGGGVYEFLRQFT
jgi:hypothetical protein